MFPSVLIVDDEPSILQSLGGLLSDEGFEVTTATNGYEALKNIETDSPDLVLLDIWMPGMDGIETLTEIKRDNPFIQVIIITGHGTIDTAVKATKIGAFDFIEKPLSIDKVIVAINNALNFRKLEEEKKYLSKKTIEKNSIDGNSPAATELKRQITIAAPSDSWILITGENGTGKELVARAIHHLSSRAGHAVVDVSCAAIPDELIESELLGHEKGSFPGAVSKRIGKFELADKGTLFFDEIGDMSLKTQAQLLRILEEKEFRRIGGSRVIKASCRVIASSNKDLNKEIEKGSFREDLYYRLNVIPIRVPPLRERIDDISLLIETFIKESAKANRSIKKQITPDAVAMLRSYMWPGNVRELKNLVERLAIMVKKDIIEASDLPAPYNTEHGTRTEPAPFNELFALDNLKQAIQLFEQMFINQKLVQHKHDISKTAEALGVTPDLLEARLKSENNP